MESGEASKYGSANEPLLQHMDSPGRGSDIESQGEQLPRARRVISKLKRGFTGDTWKYAAQSVLRSHQEETGRRHQEHSGPCDWCCCKTYSTHIETTLDDGEKVRWSARRHRRNRYQRDHAPRLAHMKDFVLGSLERFRSATSTPMKTMSFIIGPIFILGSIFFVIGSFGQTRRGWFEGSWSETQINLFVNIPFLVGSSLRFIGVYCSAIEVENTGHESRVHEWEKKGRQGPRPHINWLPFPTHIFNDFLSYYGTWIMYFGGVAYLTGSIARPFSTAGHLTQAQKQWYVTYPFLFGGFCYLFGAYPNAVEATGSYLLALIPPVTRKHMRSVDRWAEFLSLLGSALFAAGGVQALYQSVLTFEEWQVYTFAFYFAGSITLLLQGILLYIETINPMI